MYKIDKKNNCLIKVKESTFSDLGFRERNHLQEWIAKYPKCLGEDLLIIAKEFDGFKDTKERLDLLALDKQGNLVIIENKLDDSGRDVTWQALKYASYCSSLKKEDVISIYQQYLGNNGNAEDNISDFYDGKAISEILLNEGNHSQRIFFVAKEFRKEVTSTVLWLANYNLQITCVKVTPYEYEENAYVDFDQIIPIKDAEEYIIKMASKTQSENLAAETITKLKDGRSGFWSEFINYDCSHNPYSQSKGTSEAWLNKSIENGITVNLGIQKNRVVVSLYICQGEKEKNENTFAFFQKHRADIDSKIPDLNWEQRDESNNTRKISTSKDLCFTESKHKEDIFKYFVEMSNRFIDVFSNVLKKINE